MEIDEKETKVYTIYDYVINNFDRKSTDELITLLKSALKETEDDED